jgi:hypothetical protein
MLTGLPPLISVLLTLGASSGISWVLIETFRRTTIPGSRPRYIAAGFERALRYPAGAWLLISAVVNFHYGYWPEMAINVLGAATWGVVLVEKRHHGDDDDFWSDLSKKIRNLMTGRSTAPAGI